MAKDLQVSRRKLLKIGGASALLLGAGGALAQRIVSDTCELTPRQPEGPFYPVADQLDKNSDLTQVSGKNTIASGEFIYLTGKVADQHCQPVENAVVEIWQACETGRYNHPGDRENPNPLDPNFQYWGITTSNRDGLYNFKTIIPGHYEASPGWMRPPHIHFKVHKRGYRELITQMYFEGNRYNEGDLILRDIPRAEWPSVVRPKVARASELNRVTSDMTFDITIVKIG